MERLLSSNGIVIRPHAAHDIGPMFAAIVESMATVGRWMSWCPPNYSLQDATAWYERSAQAWANEGDREFGIFDAASGEVLGSVGINQINRVHLYGNMGYGAPPSCEKRGIASTAARLAASFAFANLGLVRIEIVVLPDNLPSRRVGEKGEPRSEC